MILFFLRFLQYYVVPKEDQEKFYIFDPQFFTKLREQDSALAQPSHLDSYNNFGQGFYNSSSGNNYGRGYGTGLTGTNGSTPDKKPTIAYGFTRVKRWTKKVDIFSKEFLLIPICENNHWTLAIICHPKKAQEQMQNAPLKEQEESKKSLEK